MSDGIISTLSKISKFDVFETLLGILAFIWGIILYFQKYQEFVGKDYFIAIIIGLLFIGYLFFLDGSSKWRIRYRREEDVDYKKGEAEYREYEVRIAKAKKEINDINKDYKPALG